MSKINFKLSCLYIIIIFSVIVAAVTLDKKTFPKIKASIPFSHRVTVHDPSIIKDHDQYYIFGSHMAWASSYNLSEWNLISNNINDDYTSIFSPNFNWSSQNDAAYDPSTNMWAPDIIYNKEMKKYCMYMSINGNNFLSSIALATADSIEGPYQYTGTVVYSGFVSSKQAKLTDYEKVTASSKVDKRYLTNNLWNSEYGTNAIDPCVTYDKNGELWMSYGSWFGGIFMLKLDNSTGLRDYSYKYETKKDVSDQYLGKKLSGGYDCTGEGSYIVYDKTTDYYYMYVSYGGLNATDEFSGYHIRLFRSKNIDGPYIDAVGNNAICTKKDEDQSSKGIKLFGNYLFSSLCTSQESDLCSNGYMSGGHNSAFIDDDGSRYLVYHTRFNNGDETHQVRVHQQFLNQDGWPVTAVYENFGNKIEKTYSNTDIIGDYEFVNHGNSAKAEYTKLLPTLKVSLNPGGTISGDINGKWSKEGYYCTMVIDDVTYKGVFFKQANESSEHNLTMTFTLIGNNNISIWGSKVPSQEDVSTTATDNSQDSSTDNKTDDEKNSSDSDDTTNTSSNDNNTSDKNSNSSSVNKDNTTNKNNSNSTTNTDKNNNSSNSSNNTSSSTNTNNSSSSNSAINNNSTNKNNNTTNTNDKTSSTTNSTNKTNNNKDTTNNKTNTDKNNSNANNTNSNNTSSSSTSDKETSSHSLEGLYFIQNVGSGFYLDLYYGKNEDRTNIRQYEFNATHAQQFKLQSDGNGYYSILTKSSDYTKCLDVEYGLSNDGTNIMQWTYWGGDMQKFKFVKNTDGSYSILTKSSSCNSAIGPQGLSTDRGANVEQNKYTGSKQQHWKLIPVK